MDGTCMVKCAVGGRKQWGRQTSQGLGRSSREFYIVKRFSID